MKLAVISVLLCLATPAALAQKVPFTHELLGERTVQVSDHVWAIIGFPNIGIVVGKSATLVVDTGLGPRNGATVARVAQRLAPGNRLYLTTTHYHPEHATGEPGFPPGTILFRNRVQQEDMERYGATMIQMFASNNAQWKVLLTDIKLRSPDVIFDKSLELNLGGDVTAQLLWFGEAHTKGDELIFVEPDKTLISGDVVQNKNPPAIPEPGGTAGGTPASWIAVLEQIGKLGAIHVLPDHSPIGNGSLVTEDKAFMVDLQTRALDLKGRGVKADDAGRQLTTEFKAKYSDWSINDLTAFVKSIYAE